MAEKYLVIVESPTKARTISKFLPKNYKVMACVGHVRDLPQSAAAIPKKYKAEPWSKIGVNVDKDFEPLYVIPKGKSKIINEIKKELKKADELILATDEDREGESISWHLSQILKVKVPSKRMVFHEITKTAIQHALENYRELDHKLVKAQETRRILDRLVGYTVSPLLWKKIAFGLSAGRVQSVALRLIVEREQDRIKFKKASYWDLSAAFKKGDSEFTAKLLSLKDSKLASGKDFNELTGKLKDGSKVVLLDEKAAKKLKQEVESGKSWIIQSIEDKNINLNPPIPFITSTFQQEANRKLGLSSRDSMRAAQRLYESGLITYMRTDSPTMSKEGTQAARDEIEALYGKEYLSEKARIFKAKNKASQEAHEAIRPAGHNFVHPKNAGVTGRELKVYDLIWKRTLACQMSQAKKVSSIVKIKVGDCLFQASGSRIAFAGFLRAYVEGSDDPTVALQDKEFHLPTMKEKEELKPQKVEAHSHETKAPARYTEASLIKIMENEGVGRPSTYTSIVSTIVDRGYVRKQANAFIPTYTGFAVTQFLRKHFQNLVDLSFTATMEESLDQVAVGEKEALPYLKKFYLGKSGLRKQVEEKEEEIDPVKARQIHFENIKNFDIRIGRYGAYLIKNPGAKKKSDEIHVSIPDDLAPADLTEEKIEELIAIQEKGPEPIGEDPKTGQSIYLLTGRYGPYYQLGEVTEEVPKPRRASFPKDRKAEDMTLPEILKLLSLPRELGVHPDTGEMISANNGRFGPYVVHKKDFRSLKKDDDVYKVELKRALEILSEPKKGRGGSVMIKEVGEYPKPKKAVSLYKGRYGYFLKMGTKNFGLPKEIKPEELDIKEAIKIIDAKK